MFIFLNNSHSCECDEEMLWCYSQISYIVEETKSRGKIKIGQHEFQITIKFYYIYVNNPMIMSGLDEEKRIVVNPWFWIMQALL